MMEVKGIGQRIPKAGGDLRPDSKFEALFDESKRKLEDPNKSSLSIQGQGYEIPLDLFKATHLNSNPFFVALQNWMAEFNKGLQNRITLAEEVHTEEDYHLNILLYDCLKKLLREIIGTHDRIQQSSYLQRVHTWFVKRHEKAKRMGCKKELGLLEEKDMPESKPYVPELPSKKMYEENMRTLHPDIPPPKERMTEYNWKGLAPEKEVVSPEKEKPSTIVPSPPLIQQKLHIETKPEKKMPGIEAKSNFLYYQPQDPEEQKMERVWFAKKNKEISEKRVAEENAKVVTQWGFAKERLNENVLRKHENKNFANNFAVRNYQPGKQRPQTTAAVKREMDYKQIYDEASSEEEEPEEVKEMRGAATERKERKLPEIVNLRPTALIEQMGALRPMSPGKPVVPPTSAKTSTRPQTKQQPRSPARSPAKSPPKTAAKSPDRIPARGKEKQKVANVLPNTAAAIVDADKMKVNYIRKMYGHLIGATDDCMDTAANIFVYGPKGMNTLSIYNKDVKRPYTASTMAKTAREYPLTHQGNREQFRICQIKEINRIKEHLAKEDIPCSVVALQRAILIPEDYPAFRMTAENFAKPGCRLIVNPYAKKKKKGKKKKKAGKR